MEISDKNTTFINRFIIALYLESYFVLFFFFGEMEKVIKVLKNFSFFFKKKTKIESQIKETKKKKEKKERNDKRKKSEFLPDENRRGKFLSFSSMYDMKKGFSPVSHSASIRKEELSALLLEAETQPVDHVGMHVILESLELQMRAAGFCSKYTIFHYLNN